jgi:hypothetical protein
MYSTLLCFYVFSCILIPGGILYKPIIKLVNDGIYYEVDISLCSRQWKR